MKTSKNCTVVLAIILTGFFFISCTAGDKNCTDPKACDGFSNKFDPIIAVIAGGIDDQINSTYAKNQKLRYAAFDFFSKAVFIDKAWASTCSRPSAAICTNETKTAIYTDCTLDSTVFVINGNVTLSYTGTLNCGFTTPSDTVTRTLDISRNIPDNGLVTTSSNTGTDFRGIAIGGGTKLTITGNNVFNLDMLGIHKTLTVTNGSSSYVGYDLFMRTTTPFTITGGLDRSSRVINGGALEVSATGADSKYEWLYTFTAQNLTYSTNCCYPVSGALNFTETASLPDTGTVAFNGCGKATIYRDGDSYDVPLVSCE